MEDFNITALVTEQTYATLPPLTSPNVNSPLSQQPSIPRESCAQYLRCRNSTLLDQLVKSAKEDEQSSKAAEEGVTRIEGQNSHFSILVVEVLQDTISKDCNFRNLDWK